MFTLLKVKRDSLISAVSLAFLSGILLSLPWHGFPGWVLFVALIPLLFAEKLCSEAFLPLTRFLVFWIAFLCWNLISAAWMLQVDVIGGLLIILINSLFMGMLFSLFSYIQRKKPAVSGVFILVLLWISYEYFLIHGKPGWPWLLLGNGLGSSVYMVQWYDRTGGLGGSLWVLIVNILLFRFLSSGIRQQSRLQFLFSFLSFLLILLGPWIG